MGVPAVFTSGYLVLNSATALAEVELVNNIDLNGATRTIQVDDNAYTGTDFATISGNISGTGGLTKTGSGMLFLTGANSYTGDTAINGGWLFVTSLGKQHGNSTSSVGAWGGELSNRRNGAPPRPTWLTSAPAKPATGLS